MRVRKLSSGMAFLSVSGININVQKYDRPIVFVTP